MLKIPFLCAHKLIVYGLPYELKPHDNNEKNVTL